MQSIYESFLLNELGFPKANEATPEIEIWVDQVVHNWKIICGPTWRNEDHMNGGKEATSRLVLEVSEPLSHLTYDMGPSQNLIYPCIDDIPPSRYFTGPPQEVFTQLGY